MSTIKQHAPRPLYVYLSSEGIDSLLQYAIMPAGAVGSPAFFHLLWVHFDGKAGGKIIKIAIVYGLMMSSLKLSRVVGSDLLVSLSLWRDINQQPDQQALAFVLAVCCIALTFSYVGDNCYLVALLSIIITSTGCIMSERFGNAFVKHQRPSGFSSSTGNATIAMNGLSSMPSSNLVNSSNSFYSPENKLRRNMIAYIFSTLLVSLLFHEDTKFAIAKVSTPTEINRHGVTAADFIHHCHFSLYALLAGFAVLVFLYHVYTGFHARLHSSITLDSISSSSSHGRETPHKSFWSAIFSSRQSQDIMGDITLSHVETNEEVTNGSQEKSPLIIPTDGFIPSNFVVACKGNTIDATKMYHSSLRWRHSNGTDSILSTPQPNFQQILDYYPHYIHGYSIDGCVVVYELLGRAKLRELTAKGITPDDLVRHFNLRNEFIFKRFQQKTAIYPILTSNTKARSSEIIRNNHGKHQDDDIHNDQINRDQASIVRIMTIIDVKGISLYDFTADVVTFIKQSSEIMDAYYPGHVERLVIINAPTWFNSVWGVVTRVLPENVRKKIVIGSDTSKLSEFIEASQRPVLYGGTDVPLGESEVHREFLNIEKRWATGRSYETLELCHEGDVYANKFEEGQAALALDNSVAEPISTTANKRSVWGWIYSKFREDKKNIASATKKATTAFLGEKNLYRYDVELGTWTLDDASISGDDSRSEIPPRRSGHERIQTAVDDRRDCGSSNSSRSYSSDSASDGNDDEDVQYINTNSKTKVAKSPNPATRAGSKKEMSPSELEEHALLLAIQAAHFAKLSKRSAVTAHEDHGGNSKQIMIPSHSSSHGMHSSSTSAPRQDQDHASLSLLSNEKTSSRMENHNHHRCSSSSLVDNQRKSNYISQQNSDTKLSSDIFIVVVGIYVLATSVHCSLMSLLPLWMYAPKSFGGGGYSVQTVSLMASTVAFLLLIVDTHIRPRMTYILKSSPLRALRIGCGTFIVGSLLLPWTVPLSMKAITTADSISSRKDMHPLSIVSTSDTKRMHNRTLDFRWIQHVNNNSFFNSIKHSHNSSYDYSFDYRYNSLGEDITQLKDWILSIPTNCLVLFQWISIAPGFIYQAIGNATGLTHRSLSSSSTGSSASGYSLPALALTTVSPSPLDVTVDTPLSALLSTSSFVALDSIAEETIVSLILPCTLLALIVGASYLCRKASMILLQVALTPVFAEPKGMVRMITNIVDVAVPFLACLVFGALYDLGLPYPMNAVSFLSISICILSFLYVCTLLLNLKFQGDFGTIIDDSTALTSSSSIRLKNPRTGVSNTWSSKGMTSRGRGNNSEGGVEDITISYPSWYPAINATGNSFDPLNAATGWCPCCNSLSLSCCDPVIRELISIPEEDLLLLFSPPKYGYGTKLYNLKVDVKDV